MKILAETHTHTIASTHAYNTVTEMINEAIKKGLELISITDHAPNIPDSPHFWHFMNLKAIPYKVNGLYVLRGAEVNLCGMNGEIDLEDRVLKMLDVCILSAHNETVTSTGVEDMTNSYIKALNNPYIDILGHSGAPEYEYDLDKVLLELKRLDKCVEINCHSFVVRPKNLPNCRKIARRASELGTKIVVGSDAHSIYEVGFPDRALEMMKDLDINEELVMNTSAEKFLDYICNRKGFNRQKFESEVPGASIWD